MLDHAFGTLGLHRIALYVFEFNEPRSGPTGGAGSSSRAAARVDLARRPLVGRAGHERHRMDWRTSGGTGLEAAAARGAAQPTPAPIAKWMEAAGAGASDRMRRTIGRLR